MSEQINNYIGFVEQKNEKRSRGENQLIET